MIIYAHMYMQQQLNLAYLFLFIITKVKLIKKIATF